MEPQVEFRETISAAVSRGGSILQDDRRSTLEYDNDNNIEEAPSTIRPSAILRKIAAPTEMLDDLEPDEHDSEAKETTEGKGDVAAPREENERLQTAKIRFTGAVETSESAKILKVDDHVVAEFGSHDTAISTPSRLSHESILEVEDLEKFPVEEEYMDALSTIQSSDYDTDDDYDDFDNLNYGYEDNSSTEVVESVVDRSSNEMDSIQAKEDFLLNFQVPSLSNLSDVSDITPRKRTIPSSVLDVGKFVDPISGRSLHSLHTSSSQSSPEVSEEVSLDVESIVDNRTDVLDFSEAMELTKVVIIDEPEDVFGKFTMEIVTSGASLETEEDHQQKKIHKEALKIALDFMNDIFNAAFREGEKAISKNRHKKKLNKKKLMLRLIEEKEDYLYEKEVNSYLNGRMCDYYRRQKITRPFMRLPDSMHQREYKKYKQHLLSFDFCLKLSAETKKKVEYLLSSVLMDLAHVDNIALRSEQSLEYILHEAIGRRSEYLRRVVEGELTRMRAFQYQLSDTRLELITKKHTLGRIRDKINSLEHINDNISMEDFIAIQNQVTAMNKKIEERNVDLKRLRINYHSHLHTVQHNREKTMTIASKLKEYVTKLNRDLETQRELRERLYKGKVEHARLRKLHSDLTYQGGLLSMPALMHDFDETVEKVESKQMAVNEMRETLGRLSRRLQSLETRGL